MKDAFMCGKEVDMSELVANVKGPSEWYCKDGKDCWYNEYSTLVSVFPDNIALACDVGECANEQDFLDAQPIERQFSRYTESMIVSAILMVCLIIFVVTKVTVKRQRRLYGSQLQLSESDDEQELAAASIRADHKQVFLTFDDVCYSVAGRDILSGLSGYVEPGQMLAIMGPSGAGKSSLLDILSRKHKRGVTSGRIQINGHVPDRRQFKRMTGFVDQDDTLMGTLTVRETLMYAAMLRLPRSMNVKQKQKRVADVMNELGIESIADSMIGVPGQRGISGGEKRRVSIGKELVTNPSLLFLDEPTSGLDAYNAGIVMACLQRLAKQGQRTVVVTIHQPRSNIFKMFDSLLLLAAGQMVYFGAVNDTPRYFRDIGFPVPEGYNVADYLIDLTMKKPEETNQPQESLDDDDEGEQRLNDLSTEAEESSQLIYDAWRSVGDRTNTGDFDLLSESNHTHQLFESYKSSALARVVKTRIRQATADPHPYSVRVGASSDTPHALSMVQFLHETSLLSSRTFINLYRNPFLFFAHFACSIALGVLLGSLFWQVEMDLSGIQNRLGVLFFMCALLGFASTSALDMFSKERVLYMRERENGYYAPSSYFVAKILFDIIPLRVLPPLVMGSVAYYMIGLNPALYVFGKFLLVLVLFNLAAAGLCLCFATAFKSISAANLLANLVILFSMLFGGFLLNKGRLMTEREPDRDVGRTTDSLVLCFDPVSFIDHIPSFLSWLQYLSFFNYGYEALIVNELKDITLRDKSIADIQIPGPIILARFGFNGQAFWRDVIRLCIFIGITMTVAFAFLKYLVKERR
ncbi:uncharacterized protein BYT42DRAFT_110213 [Radiomyces spectabilis]|uniref:uncharacterized protein n=1 Tax=Radiomyces spectabilis TaxID=64574 RepID=UPI002221057D|nr:uncharacterized protein BYT42DRAFT_110213 [Radiomyces spectabilis]KAI8369430.1 hypothetical protein BYT42DRAFT_110213 [Radiomyces spectabilis]